MNKTKKRNYTKDELAALYAPLPTYRTMKERYEKKPSKKLFLQMEAEQKIMRKKRLFWR